MDEHGDDVIRPWRIFWGDQIAVQRKKQTQKLKFFCIIQLELPSLKRKT